MTTPPKSQATQYAATSRYLVSQAGKIVLDANDESAKGTFDFAKAAKSASQLVNLALTAGLQLAPPIIPIPCIPKATEEYGLSDYILVDSDNNCDRVLSVAKSFVQAGTSSCVIPDEFVVFSPAVLPRGGDKFRVKVTWPDLRSGTYRGEIRLTQIGTANPHTADEDRIIDL
ncbi:MAG: hypothetical protein QOE94_3682 [Mycobacterium sp.]|nr:hypothetical protein [Mycobacterium sp.]